MPTISPSRAGPFRLGDLLEDGELGLELLTGGPQARRRRVAGAHASDLEHPAVWLEPEWILLTNGQRLRRRVSAQRRLIDELAAAGTTALGFGLGLDFQRVPRALLDAADARGFPVFAVPLGTPFRDVIRTVDRALLSTDLRTLQRTSSMQLYLMQSLGEPDPRQEVVKRLASFLDATAVLLSPTGSVQAASGRGPAQEIWRELTARPATIVEFDAHGRHVLAAPVGAGHGPVGWLVVMSTRPLPSVRLARQATRAAAPVLAALSRIDDAVRDQERAIRSAILDELLTPSGAAQATGLAARAAAMGIDFTVPARAVVIDRRSDRLSGDPTADVDAAGAALSESLTERGIPHLSTRRAAALVVLVQGGADDLQAHLLRVIEPAPDLVAGVGRPAGDPAAVVASFRDARIALHRLTRREREPGQRILSYERFDLVAALLSEATPERIAPQVAGIIDTLRAGPGLYEAVDAYFSHDLDIMRAAGALHVHHNTLRNRLGRVEAVLGRRLKDPATIALLHLAREAEATGAPTRTRAPATPVTPAA